MKYRSDIDGLRSLAIIPVVLCHLGVASFAGGFVGVDVFFVISGYLIGRILLEEAADGTFSLTRFYERRIRRILPALMAMVLGSFALAWFLFLPDEMMLFGRTAVAALLSYSNFHFNATADYFAAPAKTNPLLHTWSLAVEEQFYVAFPLLLLAWKKWSNDRRVLIGLVAALMVASITISAIGANARETSAFYLPHSRAWELLAGVVLAMGIIPEWRSRWMRHGASLLGIGMIVCAVLTFSEGMKFPGLNALYPVLGTMLVIHAGQGGVSLGGRILSLKPLVGIGLVSYSWYLWHWPLIVFFRGSYHSAIAVLKPYEVPLLLAVSFALAVLSWLWVERPFRGQGGMVRFPRRRLFVYSAVAMVLLVGVMGSVWKLAGGLPQRFPAELMAQYKADRVSYSSRKCLFNHRRLKEFGEGKPVQPADVDACVTESPDKPNVLVLGDSHAAAYFAGLQKAYPDVHMSLVAVTSCREWTVDASSDEICKGVLYHAMYEVLPRHPDMQVLLISNWQKKGDLANADKAREKMAAAGHRVQVLGPIPLFTDPLPKLRFFGGYYGDDALAQRHLYEKQHILDGFEAVHARSPEAFVPVYDLLCQDEKCITATPDGHSLFYDKHHFNDDGAHYVGELLSDSNRLRFK